VSGSDRASSFDLGASPAEGAVPSMLRASPLMRSCSMIAVNLKLKRIGLVIFAFHSSRLPSTRPSLMST